MDEIDKYRELIGENELLERLIELRTTKKLKPQPTQSKPYQPSKDDFYSSSPNFIHGTLRDYQIIGVNWLIKMHSLRINCILADEMGLGKTLQTITFLGYLKYEAAVKKPSLVIVPKSTLDNWYLEMNKFLPKLRIFKFYCKRDEITIFKKKLRKRFFKTDVVLTTYEMCLSKQFLDFQFCYIIIDEAHRIKNENSKLSGVVRKVQSEFRLLITGTPLQNNVRELWALLNFLAPGIFHDSEVFENWILETSKNKEEEEEEDERDEEKDENVIKDISHIEENKVSNDDKDNKISHDYVCDPQNAENDLDDIEKPSFIAPEENKKVASNILIRKISNNSESQILEKEVLLKNDTITTNLNNSLQNESPTTSLNQQEDSTSEITPSVSITEEITPSTSPNQQKDLTTEIAQEKHIQTMRSIIMPFFMRREKREVEKSLLPKIITNLYPPLTEMQKSWYAAILRKDISSSLLKSTTHIHNLVIQLRKVCNHPYLFPGAEPEPFCLGEHLILNCGKMIILDKLLNKLKNQNSKVLIFTQWTSMLDIIDDYCTYRNFSYYRLDGTTLLDERINSIQKFNTDSTFLFLLTTRAGGLGINLTAADTVIIYDCDWNPQMDLQAMDRAHRIGQKSQVRVYKFIADNTIEEKILIRCYHKLKLDERLLKKNLEKAELIDILCEEIESKFSDNDFDLENILAQGEKKTLEMESKIDATVISSKNIDLYKWNVDEYKDKLLKIEKFVVENSDVKEIQELDFQFGKILINHHEFGLYKEALLFCGNNIELITEYLLEYGGLNDAKKVSLMNNQIVFDRTMLYFEIHDLSSQKRTTNSGIIEKGRNTGVQDDTDSTHIKDEVQIADSTHLENNNSTIDLQNDNTGSTSLQNDNTSTTHPENDNTSIIELQNNNTSTTHLDIASSDTYFQSLLQVLNTKNINYAKTFINLTKNIKVHRNSYRNMLRSLKYWNTETISEYHALFWKNHFKIKNLEDITEKVSKRDHILLRNLQFEEIIENMLNITKSGKTNLENVLKDSREDLRDSKNHNIDLKNSPLFTLKDSKNNHKEKDAHIQNLKNSKNNHIIEKDAQSFVSKDSKNNHKEKDAHIQNLRDSKNDKSSPLFTHKTTQEPIHSTHTINHPHLLTLEHIHDENFITNIFDQKKIYFASSHKSKFYSEIMDKTLLLLFYLFNKQKECADTIRSTVFKLRFVQNDMYVVSRNKVDLMRRIDVLVNNVVKNLGKEQDDTDDYYDSSE